MNSIIFDNVKWKTAEYINKYWKIEEAGGRAGEGMSGLGGICWEHRESSMRRHLSCSLGDISVQQSC